MAYCLVLFLIFCCFVKPFNSHELPLQVQYYGNIILGHNIDGWHNLSGMIKCCKKSIANNYEIAEIPINSIHYASKLDSEHYAKNTIKEGK